MLYLVTLIVVYSLVLKINVQGILSEKESDKNLEQCTLTEDCVKPTPLVNFTSTEGRKLLRETLNTEYGNSFFKVISNYRTQEERNFCGLSTITFVLNILELDRYYKEPWNFQEKQLVACPSSDFLRVAGLPLTPFTCLAALNGLDVETVFAETKDKIVEFREVLKKYTSSAEGKTVLTVNYNRERFGFLYGHFSPVAAYHETSDRVLVAEVGRYDFEPQWLYLPQLWQAMMDIDSDSNQHRGYSILRARTQKRPLLITQLMITATYDKTFQTAFRTYSTFAKTLIDPDSVNILSKKLVDLFSTISFCCVEKDFCLEENLEDTIGRLEMEITREFCKNLRKTQIYGLVDAQNANSKISLFSLIFLSTEFETNSYLAEHLENELKFFAVRDKEIIAVLHDRLLGIIHQ